jgi:hypothetical protein
MAPKAETTAASVNNLSRNHLTAEHPCFMMSPYSAGWIISGLDPPATGDSSCSRISALAFSIWASELHRPVESKQVPNSLKSAQSFVPTRQKRHGSTSFVFGTAAFSAERSKAGVGAEGVD